jgi:hypothetical protein
MTERLCQNEECRAPLTTSRQVRFCCPACGSHARRGTFIFRGRLLAEHHPEIRAAFQVGYERGFAQADKTAAERRRKRQQQREGAA